MLRNIYITKDMQDFTIKLQNIIGKVKEKLKKCNEIPCS